MIIGRVLAYISFAVTIMVLGAEGLRLLQGRDGGWITVSQIADFIFVNDAIPASSDKTNQSDPGVWQSVSGPLDDIPAFLVFMIIAVLLMLICRRRFG